MPHVLAISGEYPPDWPAISDRVCAESGHRCIRCGHPFTKGTHGKGEWSPCDEKCTHRGPFGILREEIGDVVFLGDPTNVREELMLRPGVLVAQWRVLTVHHFDGNKANCEWYNLMALCQRCHLKTQARVNPQQPYIFEHSAWIKPYVAGFYAMKYLKQNLTREQVTIRMDELLALERMA